MPQTYCTILINGYVLSVTNILKHGARNRMYLGVGFCVRIREGKERVSRLLHSAIRSDENLSQGSAGVPGASNSQHHRRGIKKHH